MLVFASQQTGLGEEFDLPTKDEGDDNPEETEEQDNEKESTDNELALEQELEAENQKESEIEKENNFAKEFLADMNELEEWQKKEKEEAKEREDNENKEQGLDWKRPDSKESSEKDVQFKEWQKQQNLESADKLLTGTKKAALTPEKQQKQQKWQESSKQLTELMGVLLGLMSRGLKDMQIARTLSSQAEQAVPGENLMQTVEAIRAFINECNTPALLSAIKKTRGLPSREEALESLSHGDNSKTLKIMEKSADMRKKLATTMKDGPKKDKAFADAATMACHVGTIACLTDQDRAFNAFSKAITVIALNIRYG